MTNLGWSMGVALLAIIFFSPVRCEAQLGGSVESIAQDQKVFSAASVTQTQHPGYTVYEFGSSGMIVKEFVSGSGHVFAFTWSGVAHPNISLLLGSYVTTYRETMKSKGKVRGSRHILVKGDHLVVEKWGHQRKMQGRAYDPALLPTGVKINEIN